PPAVGTHLRRVLIARTPAGDLPCPRDGVIDTALTPAQAAAHASRDAVRAEQGRRRRVSGRRRWAARPGVHPELAQQRGGHVGGAVAGALTPPPRDVQPAALLRQAWFGRVGPRHA